MVKEIFRFERLDTSPVASSCEKIASAHNKVLTILTIWG